MKPNIPLEKILRIICEYYDVEEKMVRSVSRKAKYVKARQVYFYLSYEFSGKTQARIGMTLGRDHSTVLYAHNKIKVQHQIYFKMGQEIKSITEMLFKPTLVVDDINLIMLTKNYSKSFIQL